MSPQAQGSLAQLLMLMEPAFNTAPTGAFAGKSKKVYFETASLAYSRGLEQSKIIRGASRHPTRGTAGTTDVGGSIPTELQATMSLLYAALGSVSITASAPTVGAALTTPTFAYDWVNQIVTVTCGAAHSLVIGDTIEMVATAPTVCNGTFYYPVIDVTSTTAFKIKVPMGGSSTITVTTIKKCTAGVFTYTYKAGGKLPSYITEVGYPDIGKYFKYTGLTNSKFGMTINPTGVVAVSSDWMGATETVGAASFDTGSPIDNTKISFDGSMLAAADMKEGGDAIALIKNLSFNLDNALDGDTFVVGGGGVRGGINPGVYQITGSVTTIFTDTTLYEKAKNSTESSLDAAFKKGSGDGTAGNEAIQVVTPELIFTPKAPGVPGPGGVTATYDFVGDYTDNADATAFKIIVKCTQLPGNVI
ncbi:hypothetical protein KI809_18660 [Geobacter pelophilus]|uniref:Uncharacterized protein n=1 Tax=Geoanaerobacter pelophilus TaxID=60036 RepID=A0AAW4L536_9BACT|nr:phage tail tube protein [Geoanaerobacter pelophilus]MBT0666334.1 hypothetical protein [Geoanaerobacter pelophilus]